MDEFGVEVKFRDVEPVLRSLESSLKFDPIKTRVSLYKNPPASRARPEEMHISRPKVLKDLNPPGFEQFIKLLEKEGASPVIKLKQPSQKDIVVKTTHSQSLFGIPASLALESGVSQLMSKIQVGPRFIDSKRIRHGPHIIVEQFLSRESGYLPINACSTQFAFDTFPKIYGALIGKVHKYTQWTTVDGSTYQGCVWYGDRIPGHLYFRAVDNDLKLLDFGVAKVMKPDGPPANINGRAVSPRELLKSEFYYSALSLLRIVFPGFNKLVYGTRFVGQCQDLLDAYSDAYHKESGFRYRAKLKDVISYSFL
jgi:hypothetical protein